MTKVNKFFYVCLCMFFGTLGIHRFYSKKVGIGILYLFTGGLFGIGVIYDLLSGIFTASDSNGDIWV